MKRNFFFTITLLVMAWCTAGTAQASPSFQILAPGTNQESIGDPGGTAYPSTASATPGPGSGLPTVLGGWPSTSSFVPDSVGYNFPSGCTGGVGGDCTAGISGFDGSYLNLTEPGTVTFQYMGKGDAVNHNQFQISLDGGATWVTIFDNWGANGTCGASGSPTPVIDCSYAGSSASYNFPAGLIPFRFVDLTNGLSSINDGTNNLKDIPSQPGYILGVDPYLASGPYNTTGQVVYAGFTDRPQDIDHDYEDLIVRMTVSGRPTSTSIPTLSEWGMILLAGILGLGAIISLRQRRQ